ncbi:uncharacterized protein FTJAE_628 [Fusarium tjaetaba]|uniref:Uncharacterized protein n=1 Tax=Fusarium tjaetaba TaxID=1567544 RepID=A0A8H5SFU3_9HYPO|nr:uncharacterized protein FTJAE_628 [Fusarium tjaetaba]KAF5650204.1 hypothetical protein FTJAE_628 [Fusarium tjaetaba]
MDDETIDDARDLITIVSFLLCGPLYGILTALRRKAETHTYKRTFNRYAEEMVNLLEAIENAHTALNTMKPGHFGQMLDILQSILVSGHRKPVKITPIVPIELLMRVVTARKKWDSLEQLCEEYRNLNIAKSRGLSAGLPKTTFLCIGAMPNSDPVYIISTSADHWPFFWNLNNFVLKLRHSRRKAITKAVPGGEKDARLIKEWSETLEGRRKRMEENSQRMEPLALFRYEVPDNLKEKERVESHKVNLGLTCAET